MSVTSQKITKEALKKVKSILISQPKPKRSPYYDIETEFGVQIDWRPFIQVEPVSYKEFRKTKIKIEEYSIIIFTSKNSIKHFFRMCEEKRYKVPADQKYYCTSEAVANYLQKFITYRKRKVFVGTKSIVDLANYFNKHKEKETYLLPCSNLGAKKVVDYLEQNEINYKDAIMYNTVACDLSDLDNVTYDVLVFFSPLGIESLFENFPDFEQNDTRIAVFGSSTESAVAKNNLKVNIKAPAVETPSMSIALKKYLKQSNL